MLLVMTVWLMGCGSGIRPFHYIDGIAGRNIQTIEILVDKKLDKKAVEYAVNAWNISLNGVIKLEVIDWDFDMETDKIQLIKRHHGWILMGIESDNKLVVDKPGWKTLGWTNKIGGDQVYIILDRIGVWEKQIVTHEIGHLMGAKHTNGGLMNGSFNENDYSCVDKKVIEQVSEIWNIPMEKLRYCERD